MNKEVKRLFNDVKTSAARYITAVNGEFSSLSTSIQQARERYSTQYANQAIDQATLKTRKEIANAFKELQESWKGARAQLERRAAEYVMQFPNPAFVENLRLYKDFDLQLSRQELDSLILTAAGNYTALRLIASVANNSGFVVSCPNAETYSRDLDNIQRSVERLELYRPERTKEIEAVLTRIITVPRNKLVDLKSATDFTISLQNARNFGNKIDEISERWSNDFVPEISIKVMPGATRSEVAEAVGEAQAEHFRDKLDAIKNVNVGRNDMERLASDLGRTKREANERADAIMNHFKGTERK